LTIYFRNKNIVP